MNGTIAGARPGLLNHPWPLTKPGSSAPSASRWLTLSDTRTADNDTSGDILAERITSKGHTLAARLILREDADELVAQFSAWIEDPAIDCVISTGGTGLTGRDVTPEALERIIATFAAS
jgi:molybdenum cofactor biosynthesis protein B